MAERIVVLSPVAQFRKAQRVDVALPDSLSGKVLGILNNNKPNAAVFFGAVAEGLAGGHGLAQVVEVTQTAQGVRIDKVWVALDVGQVIDPINFDNQVKGAVVWGLGHAMNCEVTYADGMAQQTNFHAYPGMRLNQCPVIEVRGLAHGAKLRGAGEPPVPPAAPALANAIFAATGVRLREMPFSRQITFV